ncbi:right-handed parallel beta-helix repeat-containing protein [Agrobacterium deltaense]
MVDITAAEVFRDFVTDGVPSSGAHNPRKPDIRKLLKQFETIIAAFTSNGGVIYASKAALDADLARPANTMAWVLGDATAASNGIYRKVGASGAGNWVRAGDLPYSFILASNVGAGTPSAIQATTSIPVSGSALILLQIAEDYAGEAATVSFNGGAALTIKTNSGEDVRNLAGGSVVYGVISGGVFRLANDEAIASLIYVARDEAVAAADRADAEADRSHDEADRSEAARDIAAGYASDAVSQGNVPIYATVLGMPALEIPVGINAIRVNGYYAAGDGGGALYVKVDDEPVHAGKFQTADGAWWAISETSGNPRQFGARGDGVANDSNAFDAAASAFRNITVKEGVYRAGSSFTIPKGVTVVFDEGAVIDIQSGVTLTWNGGIVAWPKQRIFSGSLVQSAYQSNSLTPYVLALQGDPTIEYSTPFWFGAVADNVTDDYNACVCSAYFGPVSYYPAVDVDAGERYLCTTSVPLRRSGTSIRGDGYKSWCRLVSYIPTGVGQFFGIAGLLPTVSGGEPVAYVQDIVIDGIHVDTNNGINDNGIGGSFCKNVTVTNCHFSNVGRKAVTFQYHVHNNLMTDCIIHSAAMETGGSSSALTTEGENSSFTYANGVAGYDWDGNDNTENKFENIRILKSGYSGVTLSNARRTTVSGVTIDSLGANGRPFIMARVSKNNTFRSCRVKVSTRGFLYAGSGTTVSTLFEDCTAESVTGDYSFYSEGRGTEFIRCQSVQADDRSGLGIRGTECAFVMSRIDFTAITSATQAAFLFATATNFKMETGYIGGAGALRSFNTSGAANVSLQNSTFVGGTEGIRVGAAANNVRIRGNSIGGDGAGRVYVESGAQKVNVSGNTFPGSTPSTTWVNQQDLWRDGVCNDNIGDVGGLQCTRRGGTIHGTKSATPEGIVPASPGSTITRSDGAAGSTFYVKQTGTGNTGWAAVA